MTTNKVYEWTAKFPILEVQESFQHNSVLVGGVILRLNIPTINGNIYRIEEAEQIVDNMKGVPVFYEITRRGKHINSEKVYVGRVVKAENMGSYIRGDVEIWATKEFPDLPMRVAKGWGFSIGGKATGFQRTGEVTPTFKPIGHIHGMMANHLQLLEPSTRRGDSMAVVDKLINVQESFEFDPCPWGLCEVTEAALGDDGKVKSKDGLKRDGDETCLFERVDALEKALAEAVAKLEPQENVPPVKVHRREITIEGLGERDSIVRE